MAATSWHIHRHPELDSTSDFLKTLAQQGAPHGTVVVAERQTGGHGRTGRQWLSPPGALLMSCLLRPEGPLPLLSLMAGVAAAEAAALPDLHLKWPNDLLLGAAKCGGILVEGRWGGDRPEYLIVGIGLNVAAAPALSGTTCLQDHGATLTAAELLPRLLARLDHWLQQPTALWLDAWRQRCRLWGQEVTVFPVQGEAWTGVAVDVADDGALVLQTAVGQRRSVSSGEVRLTAAEARQPLSGRVGEGPSFSGGELPKPPKSLRSSGGGGCHTL